MGGFVFGFVSSALVIIARALARKILQAFMLSMSEM